MSEQAGLFQLNNQNLFSNIYLEHHLPDTDLWDSHKAAAADALDKIRQAYRQVEAMALGPGQEAQLEEDFIRPTLNALGFEIGVQPKSSRGKRPDYALFKDKGEKADANRARDELARYYTYPITILEAKYWGRRLNDYDAYDQMDKRDPTAQTVKYLDDVYYLSQGRIEWAILTNGIQWRLFYYRASSRSSHYYEINLSDILQKGDLDGFLYFYLFFSKDAFVPDPVTNKSFLEQHLKGSHDYAARISSHLKELIFDPIFEGLATGIIQYRKDELSVNEETEESLDEIFRGCLTLLYRILFLLYAESRGLLPVGDPAYERVSFTRLRNYIVDEIGTHGLSGIGIRTFNYWYRLDDLFRIISKGDSAYNVPVYNGGLFNTQKDDFLATHKISDRHLAEAIKLLTMDDPEGHAVEGAHFIDYSSLSVRELGDIYEGLLEFHVRVAKEDVVAVKEKDKVVWQEASKLKQVSTTAERRGKGQVYIENTRRERKATGSYYTPHYIVEYIVEKSVGPILDAKFEQARQLFGDLDKARQAHKKQRSTAGIRAYNEESKRLEKQIYELLFDTKVLDPAMGSGHFLVHAVNYISGRVEAFLVEFADNPIISGIDELRNRIVADVKRQGVRIDEGKLTEVNLIKRMVMKRCIYGVDMNPMAVELAKLSLWLDSFTLGAPLSFLDHHIKCGNSLIGAMEISGIIAPGSEALSGVHRTLSYMTQVSELTDTTIEQARQSAGLYQKATESIMPVRRRLDASTSRNFIEMDDLRFKSVEALSVSHDYDKFHPEVRETLEAALAYARESQFFHWKIEFPEAFYSARGELESPGFDAVIGNPPYVRIQSIKEWSPLEVDFYKQRYYSARKGSYDLYVLFIERGMSLLNKNGRLGFIVPNKVFQAQYGEPIRKLISDNRNLSEIIHFGHTQVFNSATTYTCLLFLEMENKNTEFKFVKVGDLELWQRQGIVEREGKIPLDFVTASEWNFVVGKEAKLFNRLKGMPIKLRDVADTFVGLQTSADDVYIMNLIEEKEDFAVLYSRSLESEVELEKDFLFPLVSGVDVLRYGALPSRQYILFPYHIDDKINLIDVEFLSKGFPKTLEYLNMNKIRLQQREKGKFKDDKWYRFGRNQNIGIQNRKKICVPRLVDKLHVALDVKGAFFLDNVDVNGISLKKEFNTLGLLFLMGLLNSKLLVWFFPFISVPFRGGWWSANRQFISHLPIRTINFNDKDDKARYDSMVSLVEQMLDLNKKLSNAKTDHEKNILQRQIDHTDRQIDTLVYELYGLTEEEIKIVEGE